MSGGSSGSSGPSWLTFLVAILAGGWATQYLIPVKSPTATGSAAASKSDGKTETQAAPAAPDSGLATARLLAPLARHCGLENVCSADALQPHLASCAAELEFLLVTVADPRDTVLGYRFDLQLDTLHKSLALDNYVLDQFYVPWEEDPKLHRWRTEPGMLVYRRPHQVKDNTESTTLRSKSDLLVVLLMGEQPTSGIHQPAFQAGLRLISELQTASPPHLLISGPMFTGTAPSLARAIATAKQVAQKGEAFGWPAKTKLRFTVVSGGAVAIDRDAFLQTACNKDGSVEFRATVGHGGALKDALIEYMHARSMPILQEFKVAWLTETVSGYGQSSNIIVAKTFSPEQAADPTKSASNPNDPATRPKHLATDHVIEIPFPLSIAQIRTSYEQDRAAKQRAAPRVGGDRYRLQLGHDDNEGARDVPRLFTPQVTAPTNELVLGQILALIRREGIRYIGISTSDIRDMVFLAQYFKQNYPTCQILMVTSDLVHLHPSYRQALAGTLVASSYPLLPDALDWYEPPAPPRRNFVLSNQNFYGMFNSVRVLRQLQTWDKKLGPLPALDNLPPTPPSNLLGYRSAPDELTAGCPPVWISMIGNDGIWPLTTEPYPNADDAKGKGDYVVRKVWWEKPSAAPNTTNDGEPRKGAKSDVTSRFVHGSTAGYLIWLVFSLLVAASVGCYLNADWCRPLQLTREAGRNLAIGPQWFSGGILAAIWVSLNFLATLAGLTLYLSGASRPTSWPAWVCTLLLAAGSLVSATIVMCALVHLLPARPLSLTKQRVLTGLIQLIAVFLIVALIWVAIAAPRGRENLILWYHYTYEGFNGVSLTLPTTLSLLAIITLCYGLLRQYFLASSHFVPRPHLRSQPDESPAETRTHLLFPILGKLHLPGSKRLPVNHLLVAALVALWFCWIGWQTVVGDANTGLFAAMLLILLVACVLWGVRLIKTVMVVRKFIVDLDDCFEDLEVGADVKPPTRLQAWKTVFERRPSRRRQELGLFFHTGRPRSDAAELRQAQARRCRELEAKAAQQTLNDTIAPQLRRAREDELAVWVEQYSHQYLAHLRTLVRWMLVAGVLIFLASSSYPFNTAQYLRLTTSVMLGGLGGVVVYAYVALDRNPLLSLVLGSEPFEFRFDWNFFRNAGPILGIALITLISQAFPDTWQWLGTIAEPSLRSGP